MPEKTPPPVKPGNGSAAARGIKSGPPVDQNSETLHGFAPVAKAESEAAAGETNAQASEATLKPGSATTEPGAITVKPGGATVKLGGATVKLGGATVMPGGATMVPQHDPAPVLAVRPVNFDQTIAAAVGPTDQTIQASPDATLGGGLDAATREFHKTALAAAPKAVATGQTFGQYELLEPIAKGGMGIVYKARQKTLNRIVAIKMILAGQFADQSDIDRFYAEAEAAAALSHPNIVAIHEIGEINGQHFFSMDFIEGKSLSGLIQENPVPPRRAAELTKIITETMEFAHEKGVVHRDLKPANVLLDKRQRPLITDFGLAKQVSNTSQLTMAGSIVGTPSYMPPEQAAGRIEDVGSWSDLYSIGAILYELLTGRPPFRAATPFETIRQVLETEPPSPRLLNPNVPKDLETICLKCLQKERFRRYGSCQELSEELGRYLRGEPIHARPISQVARFWRLCKRNPLTSSAIAFAVVALIASSIFTTAAYFRATAALAKEEISFREANQAVDEFLTSVGESKLAKLPGGQPIQKELLDKALVYNERFLEQRANDPRVANEAARSHFRVGKILTTLGQYDNALNPLTKAKEMQERLLTQKPRDEERLKALGDTLTQLGQIWTRKQDYKAASGDFDEAVQIRDRLVSKFPENAEYQRGLANAHMNAGMLAFNMAQIQADDKVFDALIASARDHFQKMQDIRQQLLARNDLAEKLQQNVKRDFAKGEYNLGHLTRDGDQLNEAIKHYQAAASALEEVLEVDPIDLENQSLLATCRRLVGDLLKKTGHVAEGRQSYERALQRLATLVLQNPDVPEYQSLQAGLLLNLFLLEKEHGEAEAARAALESARKKCEALTKKYPSVAVYQRDLAISLRELAIEKDAVKETEAKQDLEEAIRILTDLADAHPNQSEYARLLKDTKDVMLSSGEKLD